MSCDPLIPTRSDRGRRAAAVGDLDVGRTEHEHLHELVEHDTIRHSRTVTAQRMLIDHRWDQRLELVPDRVNER